MRLKPEHFEMARRVALLWRGEGYDHIVVVRRDERPSECYPCRRQDVPRLAVAGRDYYPIPVRDRLNESPASEQSASRAELWIAAAIAHSVVGLGP